MFFRGYIETKNKKAVEKFKNRTDFKSFNDIKNSYEFAGVLAEDAVLVDIDDAEQSEILLQIVRDLRIKCRVYRTTRGRHFLFKNRGLNQCYTHTKLACGLIADIKVGCKNSYAVLKINGKDRPIEYDYQKYQIMPGFLIPVRSKMTFLNKHEGDGRNNALFSYQLVLKKAGLSDDEIIQTLNIINKYIFDDELPDEEMKIITRQEAIPQDSSSDKKKLQVDKFADFLRQEHHIIKINGGLHIYKDGVYVPDNLEIERAIIKHHPGIYKAKRNEIIEYLKIVCENEDVKNSHIIAFENGLFNIKTYMFFNFDPKYIITNKIPWCYNEIAYSKIVDDTLNQFACNDKDIRLLLEEIIGYCFYRRNELGKCFILTGDKSNGKSTFLSMIQFLLGRKNTTSLDLRELGYKFRTAELFGKLANIGDDIGDSYIPDSTFFKKLVTGDSLVAEFKGENPFKFTNYAKLLFSANEIPRIKDKTGAVQRRLVIIPFRASFSIDKEGFNPYIKDLLLTKEGMEYLINIGLEGLYRVLKNRDFTLPEVVKTELKEYERMNNSLLTFVDECEDEDFQIVNEPTKKVYQHYVEFCAINNLQPMSHIEFSRRMCKTFGFKSKRIKDKDNKQIRVFSKNT